MGRLAVLLLSPQACGLILSSFDYVGIGVPAMEFCISVVGYLACSGHIIIDVVGGMNLCFAGSAKFDIYGSGD